MPKAGNSKIENVIEAGIQTTLAGSLTAEERIKCLAVAVRWVAVKNKIVMDDQGSGFEGDD